jgi:hypothetical protein
MSYALITSGANALSERRNDPLVSHDYTLLVERQENQKFKLEFFDNASHSVISSHRNIEFGSFLNSTLTESQLRHDTLHPLGYVIYSAVFPDKPEKLHSESVERLVVALDEHVAAQGDRKLTVDCHEKFKQENSWKFLIAQIILHQFIEQNGADCLENFRSIISGNMLKASEYLLAKEQTLVLPYKGISVSFNREKLLEDLSILKNLILEYQSSIAGTRLPECRFSHAIDEFCSKRKITQILSSGSEESSPTLLNLAFEISKFHIFRYEYHYSAGDILTLFLY